MIVIQFTNLNQKMTPKLTQHWTGSGCRGIFELLKAWFNIIFYLFKDFYKPVYAYLSSQRALPVHFRSKLGSKNGRRLIHNTYLVFNVKSAGLNRQYRPLPVTKDGNGYDQKLAFLISGGGKGGYLKSLKPSSGRNRRFRAFWHARAKKQRNC